MDKITFRNTKEFIASLKDGKYAIYSLKQNKFITDYMFDKISYIPSGNYFVVKQNDDIYLVDNNGKRKDFPKLNPNNCFLAEVLCHYRFREGLHAISNGKKVGVITQTGKLVVPYIYKIIGQYSEGLFPVTTFDNQEGYIDKDNNVIIPFGKYTSCSCFKDGKALVNSKEQGKVYIDKTGKIIEIKQERDKNE